MTNTSRCNMQNMILLDSNKMDDGKDYTATESILKVTFLAEITSI